MCDRQLNEIDGRLKNIISDIKYDFKYGRNPSKFLLMKYDLLLFFRNCYLRGNFDQGFGQKVRFMNMAEFYDKVFQYMEQKSFNFQYDLYKTKELLGLLKQVFVCYMGYHSVERIPRTITTSETKIYETFWNYLLHEFNIVQLPRMIFDPNKKIYIERPINEFFIPDSELRLKAELQSVKKLVPLDERYKYHM